MQDKILGWLLKGYTKRLKQSNEIALELQMEAFKQTLDVKDLIRERLKGVRPNRPDDNSILQNHMASLDDPKRLVFLGKAKDVINNETFKVVIESLIVGSEHKAMMDAADLAEVNFNRASVNGAMLVEEELEGLTAMYEKESKEHGEMTEEERLSAL